MCNLRNSHINLYRKDSGKYKLIGYVKRDMMHIIYKSNINKPTLTTYKAYTIKARENTCIDIRIKDDTTSANKDTVKLIVKRFPKYGTLSLVDSNAREKILHYCWNVTDLDFQNKLEDNVLIYAYDKPCLLGQSISTTINFKSAAPDSITTIQVKTFYDINKNGKREIGEPYRSAPVLINRFGTLTTLNTDLNGLLTQKPLIGNFNIGLLRNQFTYSTNKDSAFIAKFDSSYSLEIGFNYVQGVRGRIFEDVNNNCVFDPFVDVLLGGIKIGEKAKNAVAITDSRGEFLFNNTIGNYALQIDPRIAYRATCINSLAVQIKKDSQSTIYDFPLQKKTNYKDIKISLTPSNHIRNDVSFTQQILIENKGLSTVYNFYIKLLPSKKLQQFSSPSSNTNYNDTIFWLIDSIAKGRTKNIDVIHYITKANYTANELVNYQIWTNVQDSVLENNYYTLNETIGDIGCCDGSEKRTYAPKRYFPIDPTITYRLNFTPSGLIKRALVTDTLDASKFDLNSIQLIGSATNHTAYINTNILYVDYYSNTPLSNINYLYSINLKKSFTDSSTIRNNAYVAFDNGNLQKTNTVANTIISPILYDTAAIADICENQYFNVKFKTNYTPEADNHFKIYLSDSNGGFSQPSLLLDTIGTLKNQAFTIKSPNVNLSHQYKIKVIGSNPPAENFNSTVLPTINIHPLPSIQYTTNIKNNSICYGDTLKIIASGASEYWFYNYAKPGGTFSSNPILSERIFTNGNFEITFKTDKGCLNISKTISAGVISLPVVKLVSPNTKLCEGDALELKFSGAKKYDVYLNSKTKIDSGLTFSPYFLQVPSNKSIYSLVGYDINGCNDSSNKLTVIKNPLPAKPTITRVNRALKSNYSFGNQWLLNGVKIDSAINQFYYPPFDAIYSLQHTDTNTCQNISNVYDVRYTILSYPSIGSTLNVYPNPAQNELSIESAHSLSYNFSLFDSYGKLILENNGSQKTVLNISELSTGNYTLRIVQNNLTTHFKVTVLR
ncbi:MAG: T9SS type A sorting domain-containing protein [bacterium]|nr:T9SS type A sorting domain-containing protein [bacterium]